MCVVFMVNCKMCTLEHELSPNDKLCGLMWSGGLQESASILFWKLDHTALSESAPFVDFWEFCVLVISQI